MPIAEVVTNCISKDKTVSLELSTKEKLQGRPHQSSPREEVPCGPGRVDAEGKRAAYLISYTMYFGRSQACTPSAG